MITRVEETYVGGDIVISNIVKAKVPIEPGEPCRERVEHLGQRRMNVKVVFPADVLSCECTKVNFIKA